VPAATARAGSGSRRWANVDYHDSGMPQLGQQWYKKNHLSGDVFPALILQTVRNRGPHCGRFGSWHLA
jgi:hypothetical protein